MRNTNPTTLEVPSVLASLRRLAPQRPLQLFEALRVAELQANRFLEISEIHETPVPSEIVSRLPRISVEYDFDMPDSASGASDWDDTSKTWVLTINGRQVDTRQRFTLLHEYKHILDHGHAALRVDPGRRYFGLPPVEYVADYFAGCALMPKLLVKRAWGQGIQRSHDLALLFDVSQRAMEVRLAQIGLTDTAARCAPPEPRSRRFTPAPHRTPNSHQEEVAA
jgi:Zn-dependent peptidase ImmA (M78 family)